MKKLTFAILILLLFFSLSAEKTKFDKVNFGLGFGLGIHMPLAFEETILAVEARVLIPIQIQAHFRVEPLFSVNKTVTHSSDEAQEEDNLRTQFGVGFFYTYPFDSTMIVTGIRTSITMPYDGVYLEPLISGEYFFKHVSIAAEIAGNFYIPSKEILHFSMVTTFYFRWYFF